MTVHRTAVQAATRSWQQHADGEHLSVDKSFFNYYRNYRDSKRTSLQKQNHSSLIYYISDKEIWEDHWNRGISTL